MGKEGLGWRGRCGFMALAMGLGGVLLACSLARAETSPETIRSKVPGERDRRSRPVEVVQDFTEVKLDLQAGELLSYDIRINGLPAGKAHLEVTRQDKNAKGQAVWVLSLEIRSNRAVSLMYEVHNKSRSQLDVDGGFSRFFNLEKNEGDVKSQEKASFRYDIGNMEATYERLRGDEKWRTYHIPLTSKVLDPLSAIYYLRGVPRHDVVPNRDKPFVTLPICADRRVWNTEVFAVERPHLDVGGLKNRECLVIEPQVEFRGLFERKGRMRVWVDVQTGIPLKLTAETPIGSAEAVLSEYANCPLPKQEGK
jgi:hypothetical protein